METVRQKGGKVFLVFAGVCIIALPLVVISAFSFEPKEIGDGHGRNAGHLTLIRTGNPSSIDYDRIIQRLSGRAHPPNGPSVTITRADSIPDLRLISRIRLKNLI